MIDLSNYPYVWLLQVAQEYGLCPWDGLEEKSDNDKTLYYKTKHMPILKYLLLLWECGFYNINIIGDFQELGAALSINGPRSKNYQIEHIFPQNPKKDHDDWSDFYKNTLGNLVILEGTINNSAANLPYSPYQQEELNDGMYVYN